MNKKIYLASPHMSDEGYEQEYVKEAFDTNWIAPLGENVNKFEEELANYVGTKHAAALSAGTAAIHMAFKALDVKEGDIVFCSSLTFSATANPITYQNATPVFIDSELETWNMDPKALEKAFEKYPHPKAVIVVHLYGTPAKIEEIKAICDKHGVPLVEDAAESLGSTYKGKETGTFGKYGIYSFNGNKIITTSGGGMLVSEDEEKIAKVRFWSTQAREKARHYEHKEIGYNYRMSNIVAGIGRGQLKVINLRIQQIQRSIQTNTRYRNATSTSRCSTKPLVICNNIKSKFKSKTTRHNGSIRKRKHRIKTSMETNAHATSICKMRFHKSCRQSGIRRLIYKRSMLAI